MKQNHIIKELKCGRVMSWFQTQFRWRYDVISHERKFLLPSGRTSRRLNVKSVFHRKCERNFPSKQKQRQRKSFCRKMFNAAFYSRFSQFHFSTISWHSFPWASKLCLNISSDLKLAKGKTRSMKNFVERTKKKKYSATFPFFSFCAIMKNFWVLMYH